MKIIAFIILFTGLIYFSSCSGCSKSGRIKSQNAQTESYNPNTHVRDNLCNGQKITVKMKKENGVYKIPVMINGVLMDFIFDTGAGMISISDLEANFLYKQGKITKDDVVGSEKFQDATGGITEGAVINLKEVSIGGITIHDIQASVTNNVNAPLLLGQSALEKFGTITIDYANSEVIFQ